jgi:ketosteroid isomerase-like protein
MYPPRNDSIGSRNGATAAALEINAVRACHEALNSGDAEGLVKLSHPEIEVGGPRRTGHGTQLLREWVGRANIRLEPRRVFHQGDTVVVEQRAEWHATDTEQVTGSQVVSSIFVVRDGQITCVVRYPDLAVALEAANIDESHEIQSNYNST